MRFIAIGLAVYLLLIPAAFASDDSRRQKCEQTRQKIEKIRSKMRQGYSAAQGIRMDENLRRLKKQRSKYCR
jgi:hypothetical protein